MHTKTRMATQSEIASLEVGRENRMAAVSQIADTDPSPEMVAFTRNQMRLRSGAATSDPIDVGPPTILELLQ